MTCEACEAAHRKVWHIFHAGCKGCAARAVVRGQNYDESMRQNRQTWRYRAELQMHGLTHEDVKAEAALDVLHQAERATT
jgi:hypothetical protein